MTEIKICKGCKWNHYPECWGTIENNGDYMDISDLLEIFECGVKDRNNAKDHSIVKKTALELKLEDLEARLKVLEDG